MLQLVSPWAVRRLRSHRRWVVTCALLQAASFVPLLAQAVRGEASLALVYLAATAYWGFGFATGPAWNTWVGTLIPAPERARFFARRSRWCQAAVLTGLLGAGGLLQWGDAGAERLGLFGALFAAAGLARLVSASFLARQSEPVPLPEDHRHVSFLDFARRFRASRPAQPGSAAGSDGRLLAYLLAMQLGVNVAAPFFTPYMLKHLGLSWLKFTVLVGVVFASRIVALPLLGRLAHRRGARRLMWAGAIGITPLPPPGARPGAFVLPADSHPTSVHAWIWDHEQLEGREIHGPEELRAAAEADGVTWIEVVGLGDGAVLGWLRDAMGVHPLAVADIANVPQRPKFEDFGERDLIVAQHVRLRTLAPIRRMGAGFLAYAMVDAVIDGYFPVLESLGELLEDLEEEILEGPGRDALSRLHAVRRVLMTLHRTMWRQRDALNQILRDNGEPLGEEMRVYFRDAHDHALQVLDAIESYREVTVGLMDVYLSSVSHRLNEVMKTLTIMASIFIPLTFIAGVYGMNFDWMPELRWRWGYPAIWGVMIGVSGALLWWFRRRGWLGDGADSQS